MTFAGMISRNLSEMPLAVAPEAAYPMALPLYRDISGHVATVIERHGARPLSFLGRKLFEASNRITGLSAWSEIAVYETEDGRFVASIQHSTGLQPHPYDCAAVYCDSGGGVRAAFSASDPVARLPADLLVMDVPDGATANALLEAAAQRAQLQRDAWKALLAGVFGHGGNPKSGPGEAEGRSQTNTATLNQGLMK